MKVLFIYRHFWPDTPPYASMLRSISAKLAADGHEVSVWSEMPSYKQSDASNDFPVESIIEDVSVFRAPWLPGWKRFGLVRNLAKIAFPVRAMIRALNSRRKGECFDVVVTATIPPVVNGLFGLISAWILRAEFRYHMQDIYPEVGVCADSWSNDGLVCRILMKLDKFTCKRANQIIVLSSDMRATIEERGILGDKIVVLNNFELEDFDPTSSSEVLAPSSLIDENYFNIVFSGNIGRFQNLEMIIDCARMLEDIKDLRITFMGDGVMKSKLVDRSKDLGNVKFIPHLPYGLAKDEIAKADLGLVTLQDNIYKYAYPSKTLTYLGLGVPLLIVVESHSNLAKFVKTEAIGYCVKNRTTESLEETLRESYANRHDRHTMKNRVESVYQNSLSRESVLEKWSQLFS